MLLSHEKVKVQRYSEQTKQVLKMSQELFDALGKMVQETGVWILCKRLS